MTEMYYCIVFGANFEMYISNWSSTTVSELLFISYLAYFKVLETSFHFVGAVWGRGCNIRAQLAALQWDFASLYNFHNFDVIETGGFQGFQGVAD